jgi:uncharacterized OsmC-like protein
VSEADVKKVLALAEDKYCPVLDMIKGNTELENHFRILTG